MPHQILQTVKSECLLMLISCFLIEIEFDNGGSRFYSGQDILPKFAILGNI